MQPASSLRHSHSMSPIPFLAFTLTSVAWGTRIKRPLLQEISKISAIVLATSFLAEAVCAAPAWDEKVSCAKWKNGKSNTRHTYRVTSKWLVLTPASALIIACAAQLSETKIKFSAKQLLPVFVGLAIVQVIAGIFTHYLSDKKTYVKVLSDCGVSRCYIKNNIDSRMKVNRNIFTCAFFLLTAYIVAVRANWTANRLLPA